MKQIRQQVDQIVERVLILILGVMVFNVYGKFLRVFLLLVLVRLPTSWHVI